MHSFLVVMTAVCMPNAFLRACQLQPLHSFFVLYHKILFNEIKYGINWRNKERNRRRVRKKESLYQEVA